MRIDELERRLAVLEAMVLGRTGGATAPALDRRLTKAQVAMRRGTSTRTVDRDVERGVLPPPERENGRSLWWLSKLQESERHSVLANADTPHQEPGGRRG